MDISIKLSEFTFSIRVAGVIYHKQKVLFSRKSGELHWVLPGGRMQVGEISTEGLKRELTEELGVDFEIKELLLIAEKTFLLEPLKSKFHEITFYYHVNWLGSFYTNIKEELIWLAPSEIETITIVPEYVKNIITNPPQEILHFSENNC